MESERSALIPFFLFELIGTAALTAVVAISTYQGWRVLGVIFFGLMYYGLLRGMSTFSLRYTMEKDDEPQTKGNNYEDQPQKGEVTLSPRFNPVLSAAHFMITGGFLPRYNGSLWKPFAIVIGCTISNVLGAMLGGAALFTIIKKPGGTALDDVYKFGTSYMVHNINNTKTHSGGVTTPMSQTSMEHVMQDMYGNIQRITLIARDSSYESLDHLYTESVAMELVALMVLIYAFTVDDTKGTDAVAAGKTADALGKPTAVAISSLLLAYTFADYTGGIFNPAITYGIYMDHDLSRFWPHLWSACFALILLICIVIVFVKIPKAGMSKFETSGWYYDHFAFQFSGLFLLTLLVLQSVGDLGISTLRPERWTTVGPIFYGLGIGTLIWIARHMGYRRDYFHPLANAASGLFSVLSYTESDPIGYGQLAFVIVRDAAAVAAATGFFFYVSPLRNAQPHLSHFVALGFSTYDTKTFIEMVSQPIMSETKALQSAAEKGVSWAFLIGPEIIGSLVIMALVMATSMNESNKNSTKLNAVRFGSVSALLVYLFGNINGGLYNAWLSLFSLLWSGNISEFASDRVGRVHAFGPIILILVAALLKLDEKYNNRNGSLQNVIKTISGSAHVTMYTPMQPKDSENTVFAVATGSPSRGWNV